MYATVSPPGDAPGLVSLPIPFSFSLFSCFLIFLFYILICDLYSDEGFGVGVGVEPRLGVKRIFVLDPTGRT